ncbi:chitobiosyldiphosphodolichol beta-mannosyltransferase [Malassezia sp. CBS 17886]|nr:chitobiosyldiphosphodolichol beta-mannosyltransferase [Malassezia sp. CBS 17886]
MAWWLVLGALLLGVAACARRRDARLAAVVVVGDVARSPRMCYHVQSLVDAGWRVRLVGAFDTPLPPALCVEAVDAVPLWSVPRILARLPRALFVFVALVKVPLQAAGLFAALVAKRRTPAVVLVQTPPAIPTLAAARVAARLCGARLLIDWHNLAYTLLALRLGLHSPLVRLSAWLERHLGARADVHLFVTEAMRDTLVRDWQLRGDARVLYDRAPAWFHREPLERRHALFTRVPLWHGASPFTEQDPQGCVSWRADRPALVVSSTSWTPDEDIGMLIDAASEYERRARASQMPPLEIVVTGKGPLRAYYEGVMWRRAAAERWTSVRMHTAWLAAADYPVLLGSADVGVSLHASSSGLDLPMKVVDMLGCGLRVCALDFRCLHELVRAGENGSVFARAPQLASALADMLVPLDADATAGFLPGSAATWDENWRAVLGQRTLVTFLIDVSAGMGLRANGDATRLDQVRAFAALRILEMMMRGLTTMKVCIYTYGGARTRHVLEDEFPGDYQGIEEVWPPSRPTVETLDRLAALQPARHETCSDPFDALTVALVTMLDKKTGEPSPAWTRIIYLAIRADARFNIGDTDVVTRRLAFSDTHLCVVGVGFPMSPLDRAADGIKAESVQTSNLVFWHKLLASLPGAEYVAAADAEANALQPTLQLARSAPIKTTLSFGAHPGEQGGADTGLDRDDALAVTVQLLKATALQRPIAQRRVLRRTDETQQRPAGSADDAKPPASPVVHMQKHFYNADDVLRARDDPHALESITPLPAEAEAAFQRAYKLGASLVPLQDALEEPLGTRAGLEILHFVHADTQYRREYTLGETYYVVASSDSPRAQVALASVARAAAELHALVLCRFVGRTHTDPKLCMLAPYRVGDAFDAFTMARVPFRDDVKRFAFPPLDRVTDKNGEKVRMHATIPTPEQQALMDRFVDSMDLGSVDDAPSYTPRASFNPAIHDIKNAIKWRFLHASSELPSLPPTLARFLTIPAAVEARAMSARQECAAAFAPLAGSRGGPGDAARARGADGDGAQEDALDTDAEDAAAAEEAERAYALARTHPPAPPPAHASAPQRASPPAPPPPRFIALPSEAGRIRLAHPVEDFEALTEGEYVTEACEAMEQVIRCLLRAQDAGCLPLVCRCLDAFRTAAALLDEAPRWNTFIRALKTEAPASFPSFWASVLHGRVDLGLITHAQDAAHQSSVSEQEAEAFVASP